MRPLPVAPFRIAMPGLDGLALRQVFTAGDKQRPVIFLTGKGDIQKSVRAMKAGAVDFLTKPVRDKDLLDAIPAPNRRTRNAPNQRQSGGHRGQNRHLDAGKREVLRRHRRPAQQTDRRRSRNGENTIKVHRGRMMEKLGVHTVVDLVRLAEKAGIAAHGK